ncbi:hypothetical protein IKG_00189 [Bacillus cereus VD200]|nr:hypothetical protein IKG_00189 [Bacillus cereus VD200]
MYLIIPSSKKTYLILTLEKGGEWNMSTERLEKEVN